jgi:hypothetical protein
LAATVVGSGDVMYPSSTARRCGMGSAASRLSISALDSGFGMVPCVR